MPDPDTRGPGPLAYAGEEWLAAARELVITTRRLMHAVTTTATDVGTLHHARERLSEVATLLEERSRPRQVPRDPGWPARARERGESWETGRYNPQTIPVTVEVDEEGTARATVVVGSLFEGPPDALHGGFSAHLMDVLLGSLMQAQGVLTMTASLELTYRRPAPLDQPLRLTGRVLEHEGRRWVAGGWVEHDGRTCVEARGVFREPGR